MRKLSAIISDFDDTLFFNREAISLAGKEICKSLESKKDLENYGALMDEFNNIIAKGKIPHSFNNSLKHEIYLMAYTRYSDKLVPNMPLINYINEIIDENTELVILSARGEELRSETEKALLSNNLIPKKVILRNDYNLQDEEWKFLQLKNLMKEYIHIIFFEDKEENIRYMTDNKINDPKVEFYLVNHHMLKYIPNR